MTYHVFLLLGSNLGNRLALLSQAKKQLQVYVGKIKEHSSLYESAPWGFTAEHFFLNQVVVVETVLSPEVVLETILFIEKSMGRERNELGYASRGIDIDILFYEGVCFSSAHLIIPHPHMANRRFTLLPLVEVAPKKIHPLLKCTMEELLSRCTDKSNVIKYTTQ